MTDTAGTVLKSIRDIVFDKYSSDRYPDISLSIEVSRMAGLSLREVEAAAAELEEKGLITKGRTLNYDYYRLL